MLETVTVRGGVADGVSDAEELGFRNPLVGLACLSYEMSQRRSKTLDLTYFVVRLHRNPKAPDARLLKLKQR